jgi:hypothetical protein
MADPMQLVALDSDQYWWIWFFRTKDFSERQPTQIAMLVVDTPGEFGNLEILGFLAPCRQYYRFFVY